MRSLDLSEPQYAAAITKLQAQTSGRGGSFFRGSFFFILGYLKSNEGPGLSQDEVRRLFLVYPTLFTFSLQHIVEKVQLLTSKYGYSLGQIRELLRRNGRCIFYDDDHFLALQLFLKDLELSNEEFCLATTKEPRLISASIATLMAKRDHLLDTWGLSRQQIGRTVLFAPGILTLVFISSFIYLLLTLLLTISHSPGRRRRPRSYYIASF